MISHPWTWKLSLQKGLNDVRRRVERSGTSPLACEDARAWVEFFVHHAAFAMRKLHDSGQLSPDVLERRRLDVNELPRHPHPPAFLDDNSDDLGRHYDLQNVRARRVHLPKLCAQIIHSDVLSETTLAGESRLEGFIVASDRDKFRCCYHVALDDFFDAVERVSNDGIDARSALHLPPFDGQQWATDGRRWTAINTDRGSSPRRRQSPSKARRT